MLGSVWVNLLELSAVLMAVGAVLSALVVWLMARSLLRPPRMTDGKAAWVLRRLSPADLGLQYEEATFDVRDERAGSPLRLKAWWIPARGPSDQCVVMLHGYADAKVGVIAWAPAWHQPGFNILALDLRAHGQSGGVESTAGYLERHDVEQVINQLRAERPGQTRRLVLFGVSLGGAVAAAVAAATGETTPIDALVLESPFADFRTASAAHMNALGLPGGPFPRAALWLAERISGAKFDAVRPVDLLAKVRCAVLVVAPTPDPFCTDAEATAMERAIRSRPAGSGVGRVWQVEGVGHLMAAFADPVRYNRELDSFLAEALDASQPAGPASHFPAPAPILAPGAG